MKKYLFILAGVAFFSLSASCSCFATDSLPDYSANHVVLDSKDGFRRESTAYGKTSLNLSCRYERTGSLNFFPLTAYERNNSLQFTTSPCGYAVFQGELEGAFDQDYHFNKSYTFNSQGRSSYSPVWYNTIRDSLYNTTIYNPANYVSAFKSFTNGYNFNSPNASGESLSVPLSSEDGYIIYAFSITNLTGEFGTTAVAPLLSTDSIISVNSGSITAEEIRTEINNSATLGWVWTDSDGNKQSTLTHCDAQDPCIKVIPETEEFAALQDYLALLDDGSYFALYAIPIYQNSGYTINPLAFTTPTNLSAYGVDFQRNNEEEFWGFPMIYSLNYPNLNFDPNVDPLYTERYAVYISTLFMSPTTPEAFARSRSFAGQLFASHNNSLRYQNDLSLLDPNPGNTMWSNIFNLGNLIFPFGAFISGFTNTQCVNIPILGSWLGAGSNAQYCSWWDSSIRDVLTPIFAASSMMLLFGFIINWLRNDGDSLSTDNKHLFNNGGRS